MILDTNILLSHLDFLAELKDYAIKEVGRPVLVIPWVVMQELDALKDRQNQTLEKKARQAIRFLHQCFESHHPRVRGQTMEEVTVLLLHKSSNFNYYPFHYERFVQRFITLLLATTMTGFSIVACSIKRKSKVMVGLQFCLATMFSCAARR